MTEDEVRDLLRRKCEKAGSNRAFAIKHKITPTYIGDFLDGTRKPGPAILDALGLEVASVETLYRRKRKP